MELFQAIPDFPGYSVSNLGYVINLEMNRRMAVGRNNRGIVTVKMSRDKKQYHRSLTLLVAEAFVPRPTAETFDTPINLDGDRANNHADNILWRPRWFAIQYFDQFGIEYDDYAIRNDSTNETFASIWEAATKYGLLVKDILDSMLKRTYTWPTYQVFKPIL